MCNPCDRAFGKLWFGRATDLVVAVNVPLQAVNEPSSGSPGLSNAESCQDFYIDFYFWFIACRLPFLVVLGALVSFNNCLSPLLGRGIPLSSFECIGVVLLPHEKVLAAHSSRESGAVVTFVR